MAPAWQTLLLTPSLTKQALRDAFLMALSGADAVASAAAHPADPCRIELRTPGGKSFSVQLDNLYADAVRSAPAERAALLLQRLSSTAEIARAADGAAPAADVIPTVKSAEWVAEARRRVPELASESLVADLFVVYAFDRPQSMAYATFPELAAFGPGLREAASSNLRKRLPPELGTRGDGKSFLFVAGGNHEASLLLLDEVWEQLRASLPGDAIACALARDVCLVTSTGTPGGLPSLRTARDHICAAGTPSNFISRTILVRKGGQWTRFQETS